jgi:hypothetical protein
METEGPPFCLPPPAFLRLSAVAAPGVSNGEGRFVSRVRIVVSAHSSCDSWDLPRNSYRQLKGAVVGELPITAGPSSGVAEGDFADGAGRSATSNPKRETKKKLLQVNAPTSSTETGKQKKGTGAQPRHQRKRPRDP